MLASILILKANCSTQKSRFSSQSSFQAFKGYICSFYFKTNLFKESMKKFSALVMKEKGQRMNGKTMPLTFFELYAIYIKSQDNTFLHTYLITCLKEYTSSQLKVIKLTLVTSNTQYLELCSFSNNLSCSFVILNFGRNCQNFQHFFFSSQSFFNTCQRSCCSCASKNE